MKYKLGAKIDALKQYWKAKMVGRIEKSKLKWKKRRP